VYRILTDHLGKTKVCAKWIPKLLSSDQKQQRVKLSKVLLDKYSSDPEFLGRIVTGDENWFYLDEPLSRTDTAEWISKGETIPTRAKHDFRLPKQMATVFWDEEGLLLVEWLPPKQTINSNYYVEIIAKLKDTIKAKRRGKWTKGVILQQDNARPHTSKVTMAAIKELGYELTYSPISLFTGPGS
jgi:histone-lysine N-methyltransferase SETMAR